MSTTVIILAAGKGTRMRSQLPKVLQPLAGRPLLGHVIQTAKKLHAQNIITIYGHGGKLVKQRTRNKAVEISRVKFVCFPKVVNFPFVLHSFNCQTVFKFFYYQYIIITCRRLLVWVRWLC